MKQITVLLNLLFSCIIFSQNNSTRVVDWQNLLEINDKNVVLQPVNNRNFAVFKIENINKFLFRVSIEGKNVDIQTDIPEEMQKLFRVKRSEQEKDQELTDVKVEDAIENTEVAKKKMDQLEQSSIPITVAFTKAEIDDLKVTLKGLSGKCGEYIKEMQEIRKSIFELKSDKMDLLELARQNIGYDEMKKRVGRLKIISDPKLKYEAFENLYHEVKKLYEEAKLKAADDAISKAKVDDATDKVEKAYENMEEEEYLNLYREVKYLSNQLENENNFTIVSPPIQMEDDFVNFMVSAEQVEIVDVLTPYNSTMEFNFDIPAKKGWEFDFSVGPTVSFGKNANDEKYYLEESATTLGKSYLRQRDNNNDGTPGLATFMHIYRRSGEDFSWGGLFGVGAGFQTIEDVDLSYYLGLTGVLGKNEKFMVNVGLSFLKVDRLKEKEFEAAKEYTTENFDLDNVVEKVFKPSLFISLSYSLAKRVYR